MNNIDNIDVLNVIVIEMVGLYITCFIDIGLKIFIYGMFDKRINLLIHASMEFPLALFLVSFSSWILEIAKIELVYYAISNMSSLTLIVSSFCLFIAVIMAIFLLFVRIGDLVEVMSKERKK